NFESDKHPLRIYSMDFIKKQLSETDNVLDLGCNTGEISNEIAAFSNRVVGVDYNNELITIAKTRYKKPNLSFICTDAFSYLADTKEVFDGIILSHILEHIDDPETFLKKCIPYTNKIFIELPDFDKTYLNHYRLAINSNLNYTDADHIWEFDRTELFSLLNRVELKVIDCEFKFGVIKVWCASKTS
ncbi:MAG: class I SAM-dependent methyltransferase, partial [Chitinophagales bacterium]|nr:class I SAM-dependent methyltransferase [Chitinophagales bacterium]